MTMFHFDRLDKVRVRRELGWAWAAGLSHHVDHLHARIEDGRP
jgi:hypothetical protein